ncbi:MAG: hypothetical protein G3M70_13815 [Candidatus Nitronauta litoralis]|uniref:Uncharacterized protein n=1 Tax=Candidatus Nitronauta litoralis TaxID=2705533 RepID=A0A7T0BXQ9_9BACT|nr:MAG: hypothetical protein G3M70_13815 [Candidatus Nitronauta litoralis]
MNKTNDFVGLNEFDDYAKKFGWLYDNSWPFKNQNWESYFGPGEFSGYQMLRQTSGKMVLIKIAKPEPIAVWSGQVLTYSDFDKMIREIKYFAES